MISVGNLAVGGSGKTPVVARVATLVRDAGYRPAVLSRGYKRRGSTHTVIVSDGQVVRATVEESGDEPQMLARRLTGIPIVVSADRFSAGLLARERFAANVLILDDGFQHVQMARTVNLLLVSSRDLADQVLPVGRLREPLDAATRADALLMATDPVTLADTSRRLGVQHAFTVLTTSAPLRLVTPYGTPVIREPDRVVTVAAIANPARFTESVTAAGYTIRRQFTFRDHHWFTASDVERVMRAAREVGADAIVTTEKDAVRLEQLATGPVPLMFLPIDAHVEPDVAFREWLLARVGGPGGPP